MADHQRVLVTGATGGQGGSVARHLLQSGRFAVRCLTRNPDSPKAAALRSAGAELVAGDLADRASLDRALAGCWGAFGVTNFWEHFEKEYEHGRNLIDAVASAEVEHFVFSTLPSVEKLSGGKLHAPHFDLKAQLEEHARERRLPATFIHVAFYYENFLGFFPPRAQPDGSYAFGFPQGDTPLAAVAVEDVGGVVRPLFENPSAYAKKVVGIVGDDRPASEYAQILSRILGLRVVYQHMPLEAFAGLGFPGADDLANMFEFNRIYIPNRTEDLKLSRQLYPQIRTFDAWAQANRQQLLKAVGK